MNQVFTLATAQDIIQSKQQFPVDFEQLWQWCGYSTKANAKRQLSKFKQDMDFSSQMMKTPSGGRPSESILLSIDCAKHLAMMANTDRGFEVRQYFIKAEKVAREAMRRPMTHIQILQGAIDELARLDNKQQELDRRLTAIERGNLQARQSIDELEVLPAAKLTAAPRTTRSIIVEKVGQYCYSRMANHRKVWNRLYAELKYRYHFDAKARERSPGQSVLDIVEREGKIEELHAIVDEVLI